MAVNNKSDLNTYKNVVAERDYDGGVFTDGNARLFPATNDVSNNFASNKNENPDNPAILIIKACTSGNLNLIKEYLETGNDVNGFLITGWTLLLYAASFVQPNIIQYLLGAGADPNLHHEGYTPLMALCNSVNETPNKRKQCLKYLIDGGADVNATNKLRETALMFACKSQEIDFVQQLLKHVAHVNFADGEQRTALFYAVTNNRYDITKLLIESGADISWVNYRGLTPYYIALTKDYSDLLPLLSINNNEPEEEDKKISTVSTWIDMFPSMNEIDLNAIDNDVASMLYGMGLESYKNCFCGIDLKTFLKLREEDLERLGIDISVHRKKFVDELFKFHKKEWNQNMMKIDKSQIFSGFDAIKILGNINKQLSIMSSTVYFSSVYIDSIETSDESNLTYEEKEKLEAQMRNIQELALKIQRATNKIKSLAKIINEENLDLTSPTYIEKKNNKNSHKWIIITIFTIVSIYLLKARRAKRIGYSNKETRSWRNFISFSLPSILFEKLYGLSLFFTGSN